MKRSIFLLLGAIVQGIFGIFFLFFTDIAASQFLVEQSETAMLLQKIVGVFMISFAIIHFFIRKSPDSVILRNLLLVILFYLVLTTAIDGYGYAKGIYTSQVIGGLITRGLFILGYIYYLSKIKVANS